MARWVLAWRRHDKILNFHMAKIRKKSAIILGVGLDSDGHKRLTTGDNFALIGGSAATHEAMTEGAIKINEKLSAKGKRLEDLSREEMDEIAASVGLQRSRPRPGKN
jgi:hypothetical protein